MGATLEEKRTWSVKLDAEARQELQALLDASGERPAHFMARLLSTYKLHRAAESLPFAAQDIADLSVQFGAIEAVFGSLLMRMRAEIMVKEQECGHIVGELTADREAEKAQWEDMIQTLTASCSKLEAELKSREHERARVIKERDALAERADNQAETLKTAQELSEQYRAKAEALQDQAEDAGRLRRELEAVREEAEALRSSLSAKEIEHRQAVLEMRERHQDALEAIRKERLGEIAALQGGSRKKTEKASASA